MAKQTQETEGNVITTKRGRPSGNRVKQMAPEAIGTFVSGSVLGAVLKMRENQYLMVIPNVDFPSCVEMDIDTAALRLNLCETRIFDTKLAKKMGEMSEKQPNEYNLPYNPETAL